MILSLLAAILRTVLDPSAETQASIFFFIIYLPYLSSELKYNLKNIYPSIIHHLEL